MRDEKTGIFHHTEGNFHFLTGFSCKFVIVLSLLNFFVVPIRQDFSEKSGIFPIFHGVFNRVCRLQGDILQAFPHLIQLENFLLWDNTFFFLSSGSPHLSTDFSTPCGKLLSKNLGSCHILPVFSGWPMTFQRHFYDIYGFFPCHTNKMRFEKGFFMDF